MIDPFFVRGDPLLQRAHVGGERRLVAHGGGDAAQQRGHLGARLGEAEDVVDEEQHVLAFLVAEVFRDRQAGQRHAGAGARRLVHLAVDQRHLRPLGGAVAQLDDAGVDHLVVQVVALAGALTHAGEHRDAAMRLGDVVDQFLDQHGLAHAGAAEQADLAALQVGRQQVHHLDAGDQDFRRGGLILEARRLAVDRVAHGGGHRAALVDRVADHVQDAAQRARADGHGDRRAGVHHLRCRAPCRRWCPWRCSAPCARPAPAPLPAPACGRRSWRCSAFMMNGSSPSNCASITAPSTWVTRPTLLFAIRRAPCLPQTASAPEMISISSLVILACRVRL